MPVRKFLRDQARKAVLWALEPEPGTALPPHRPTANRTRTRTLSIDLQGKTTLVLKALLAIHESIQDSEAWQGYEGTPDQIGRSNGRSTESWQAPRGNRPNGGRGPVDG